MADYWSALWARSYLWKTCRSTTWGLFWWPVGFIQVFLEMLKYNSYGLSSISLSLSVTVLLTSFYHIRTLHIPPPLSLSLILYLCRFKFFTLPHLTNLTKIYLYLSKWNNQMFRSAGYGGVLVYLKCETLPPDPRDFDSSEVRSKNGRHFYPLELKRSLRYFYIRVPSMW